jgi:hypothetical protein
MDELVFVNCPFCGKPPKVTRGYWFPDWTKVECVTKDCAPHPWAWARDDLIVETWNTRPVEQAQAERIKQLETELLLREQDLLEASQREAEAVAECRRRRGWDQDIAHWRERAEAAEAMARKLTDALADALKYENLMPAKMYVDADMLLSTAREYLVDGAK